MKVMVWIAESNLMLLEKGKPVQYWTHEPGAVVAGTIATVQVQLSSEEYIQLKDRQRTEYISSGDMRFTNHSGTHDYMNDEGVGVED
jgi:hypothetical protein